MHEKYWFEILGGILIVVSSAVGEQMHRRWKSTEYLLFGQLALVYALLGMRIDRATEERESAAQAEAKQSHLEMIGTNEQLEGSQRQVIAKAEEIAKLNRELRDSVTGGEEFADLEPILADDQQQHRLFLVVKHSGKYPIYDVGFRVLDFRRGDTLPPSVAVTSNTFNVGDLAPKQARFVAFWPLVPGKTHYAFNFFFTARNVAGFVAQQIRYVKVQAKWLSATEITGFGDKILYRHIDIGFPKNAKGKIDWNDEAYSY